MSMLMFLKDYELSQENPYKFKLRENYAPAKHAQNHIGK